MSKSILLVGATGFVGGKILNLIDDGKSKITLLPAKENQGIIFKRVDLKENNLRIVGTQGSLEFPNLKLWIYKNDRDNWKSELESLNYDFDEVDFENGICAYIVAESNFSEKHCQISSLEYFWFLRQTRHKQRRLCGQSGSCHLLLAESRF